MNAKITLRIASVIMFLHDVGHTMAVATWKDETDPKRIEVIKQMTDNKFPFMGTSRSMGEYYDGFGYMGTLALLFIALVLWFVSSTGETNKNLTRKLVLTASIILLAWGITELIFIFPVAASFSLVSSVLGFYSLLLLNKQTAPGI